MRIQANFRLAALALFLCLPALGAESQLCFDFSKKVAKPIGQMVAFKAGEDTKALGDLPNGVNWASLRGTVKKPVKKLLELFLDHKTTASPKIDEMKVDTIASPLYLARHDVHFLIKPFLFVKVRWTEQWAYALADGTPEDPKEVVISYQKVEGTHYIEHLCGSVVLRKLGPNETDVFQYEEAKATQRSAKDTLGGNIVTLKTLREK